MTTLLALDPGGTTGWSIHHYSSIAPLTLIAHGQIQHGVDGFCAWWHSHHHIEAIDEVVSELFVDDHRTASPDTTPLRIEGALTALWGPSWIGQRNTFKLHAPDELLKRHDLWFVGEPHATDSARHALALLKTRKHYPTLMRFWPPRRGEE